MVGRVKHTIFLLKYFELRLFFNCVRVGRLQLMNNMVKKCADCGCLTGIKSTRRHDSGKVTTFHFLKKKPELNEKWIWFISRRDRSASSI